MMKKVYIIVPVFKRENLTENFIESILSQSLSFDIEFIIVDDDHELYGNYERFAKEKKSHMH
ncbi:glycosyltransferase [Vibrio parahaemolyticus]|nr:glycosyltransferase [Vibrio parahaemolyticus]MBE4185497.1 glycosyltransferase [Vibrio parahaemolyticus]